MQIQQEQYLKKLVEVSFDQCNQYLQQILELQTQLHFSLEKIEELEARIKELDPEIIEDLDVNKNIHT